MSPLPALVAFLLFIVTIAMICAYPIAFAAAAAIILNLPLSIGVRFLILFVAVWGYWMLVALQDIQRRVERQAYWTRLIFITTHLRNESDGLPAARDRLNSDLRNDSNDKELERYLETWGPLIGIAAFFAILAVMLHFGFFGDVGVGWGSRLVGLFGS